MATINLETAQQLVKHIEKGDEAGAQALLDEVMANQEDSLLHNLSELTDDLHETLNHLDDDALLMQTKHDIPDATERLEYVIKTTEEASNNTLDKAEQALQNIEQIENQLGTQVPAMSDDLQKQLELVKTNLSEIMLAQSYQDLTGQVLNRVILIISSLENSLVQLIENSKYDFSAIPEKPQSQEDKNAQEMQGVGPNVTQKSKQDTLSSQADVDSLLDDLGI